jgi:DNA-directed RNA polymerase subunit RPC12/RpoP
VPLYSFYCEENHETNWFGSHGSRPDGIECKECGERAGYRPTVSKHQGLTPPKGYKSNADDYAGLSIHDFKCRGCGDTFEDLIDHAEGENASDGKECPKCGSEGVYIPTCRIDRSSERYPYFDRGLGMIVESKQHRRDICSNPRRYGIDSDGLEPVEGDWDVDRHLSEKRREEEELLKGYDEYVDRLDNDPAFRGLRKARDQGRVEGW